MSTTAPKNSAASPQSSSHRPIPLSARKDMPVEQIEYRGLKSWVVKDPIGLRYHRLQNEQYRVMQLLNGERSLEEIRKELQREFPTLHFTLTDVQSLISELHQKGLLQSNRPGQGQVILRQEKKTRRDKLKSAFKNIMYLRLPGWDPEPILRMLQPLLSWMFRPVGFALCAALAVVSWLWLLVQFDDFQSRLPAFHQFFAWPNLLYLWAVLGACKLIHEIGHGVSCRYFGGECHEMGIMVLVFSPCLYCDVSDSWMLKSKWKRIIIAAAGMYIEIVLSAIAIFIWWFTQPGLLNYLCLNVFFVTTVATVMFNANPLMRFDGYYILSDWLEIPNLRPKANKLVREKFAWYCLGIEPKTDSFMPESGQGWFVLFAIASSIYQWVIVFGVTVFLYTFLKPYRLQSIGILLAVISVSTIVIGLGRTVYGILAEPRSEPLSRPKVTITSLLAATLFVAALVIPLPLHVKPAFLIEPHEVRTVQSSAAGILEEVLVQPGDIVRTGQKLIVLRDAARELQKSKLLTELEVLKSEVETCRAAEEYEREQIALKRLQGKRDELKACQQQLDLLVVQAPCDGRVIAAKQVPEIDPTAAREQLPRWHGSPLDKRNLGCLIEKRTPLLSIAPNERLTAILVVDQADRNDIQLGQNVEIKFDHLPDQVYRGTIQTISDRHLEHAPDGLSIKAGGDLETVSDGQGRERLVSSAYQATVVLEEDTHLLKAGMRGRARFTVDHRPAASWLWRYLRQTIHFRL